MAFIWRNDEEDGKWLVVVDEGKWGKECIKVSYTHDITRASVILTPPFKVRRSDVSLRPYKVVVQRIVTLVNPDEGEDEYGQKIEESKEEK